MANTDRVETECEFKLSEKCKDKYTISKRALSENLKRNNGKNICLFCSRSFKFTGRLNPNCIYTDLDDNLFEDVDTEEKAYILGFICGDGSISKRGDSINICIHKKDVDILFSMRDFICRSLPLINKPHSMVSLSISSNKMSSDVCKHLKIAPGKKSDTVQFPGLSDNLKPHFLRGLFDADGCVSSIYKGRLRASIGLNSEKMISYIEKLIDIPGSRWCSDGNHSLEWSGNNALDMLGFIYDNCTFSMLRKKEMYYDWSMWVPTLPGPGNSGYVDNVVKWSRVDKRAVAPFKVRASDSGYDLTIIEKVSGNGFVSLYTTGLKIQPPYGWYFDLLPRSSIYKTGHVQANSIGVIDRGYVGPIMVPLIRMPGSSPLVLPSRVIQIVPRPIVNFKLEDCGVLETSRSSGGFGSTDEQDS